MSEQNQSGQTSSQHSVLQGPEGRKKITDLIKDVHICMMTTINPDGSLDSRPMATQKTDFNGQIWFLTKRDSGKVAEIEDDAHISLAYSDPDKHIQVAAKGRGTIVRGDEAKAKIHELWNPMFKAWFPGGESDPEITVLRVDVSQAEYWEASSSKLVFGAKYLAAALTGGKVDIGESGTVKL